MMFLAFRFGFIVPRGLFPRNKPMELVVSQFSSQYASFVAACGYLGTLKAGQADAEDCLLRHIYFSLRCDIFTIVLFVKEF